MSEEVKADLRALVRALLYVGDSIREAKQQSSEEAQEG